jgi:hypothetical protein
MFLIISIILLLICDDTFIFINLFFVLISRVNHPFTKLDPNEIKLNS